MANVVEQWQIDEVMAFLHEISLEKYTKDIKKQKIDGKKLLKATQGKECGIKGIKNKEDCRKIRDSLLQKIRAITIAEMEADERYKYDGFDYDEFDSDDDYEKPVSECDDKEDIGSWVGLRRTESVKPEVKPRDRDSGVDLMHNRRLSGQSSVRSFHSHREPLKWGRSVSRDSAISDMSIKEEPAIYKTSRNPFHKSHVEDMEWFHPYLTNRESAERLLKDYGAGRDGIFLVRFSTKQIVTHPYTIMVLLNNMVEHIPIVVRPNKDFKFALGNEKPDEVVFDAVEDLIQFHKRHQILITNQGRTSGTVTLSRTPPKLQRFSAKRP